jgi:hypothetical protein
LGELRCALRLTVGSRSRALLIVGATVGILGLTAGPAAADGPDPAPVTRGSGLHPEPAPNARVASTTAHQAPTPPAAPSFARTSTPAAGSLPATPASTDNQSPRLTRQNAAPPPRRAAVHKTTPRRAPAARHPAQLLAASRSAVVHALAFLTTGTRVLAERASPPAPTRPDSTFLLIGGLALTIFVLGETAFLTLFGLRPSDRPRYAETPAAPAIRDVPLER